MFRCHWKFVWAKYSTWSRSTFFGLFLRLLFAELQQFEISCESNYSCSAQNLLAQKWNQHKMNSNQHIFQTSAETIHLFCSKRNHEILAAIHLMIGKIKSTSLFYLCWFEFCADQFCDMLILCTASIITFIETFHIWSY